MKKHNTSKITAIAALTLTAFLFLSGCSDSEAEAAGGSETEIETMTKTTVAEALETTPAVTVTAEATEPVTSAAETIAVTAAVETGLTTEVPVTASITTSAPAAWTETAASGTMYINTNGIYSYKEALQGSTKIKQYLLNETVTVTAKTDTDFYKLSDGSFIHADYLSPDKVSHTTTTVYIKPVVTVSYALQNDPAEQQD